LTRTGGIEKLKKSIEEEKRHIDETLRLFLETKSKKKQTKNDSVAISVYVHNIYMGIENIFRRILQFKEINVVKTEPYHKELLKTAIQQGIVAQDMYDTLKEFMGFRHRVVHGYGYMLEPEKMRFLIDNTESTAKKFFSELNRNGYL
jgi:uncharacterized protein YutE (UPF0331/DUF86 family)